MKKVLIVSLFLLAVAGLIAQGFTFTASEDGVSMTVSGEESSSSSKTIMKVNNSGEVIDLIAKKLENLQKNYLSKLNKLDQKKADKLLDEIYSLLALLPENANLTITETKPTPPTNTTVNINVSSLETASSSTTTSTTTNNKGMNDSDFTKLISRIQGESFSDDQLRVIRTAAKLNNFKSNQIVRIIDCFSFSDDKISALDIAYKGCLDPQNNYEILDAFTYSEDKSRAERIINAE